MKTSNEKMFTKKDMTKMAVNAGALGMEYSWNYPRQMHLAFCMMIEKCLRKIYKDDPEGYAAALTRHVAFFNVTPQLALLLVVSQYLWKKRLPQGNLREPQ